jgi:hypothetical protein
MEHLSTTANSANNQGVTDSHALINAVQSEHTVQASPKHPDQHWDGRRETLGGWLEELATVLSATSPQGYELAVEGYVCDRSHVIICCHGQAAQLDGVLPRHEYTWDNPAPLSPTDACYAVSHDVVKAAYDGLHLQRCLRDPSVDTDPSNVPIGTPYPIDTKRYTLSTPILRTHNMHLRNTILRFVADLPTRHILANDFRTDGRALLAHLRTLSNVPLTTSQVNSILADIKILTDAGIKADTVGAFKEFGVLYHRHLARINADNPSRDSPAMQANRYIQAVVKARAHVGHALMQHFKSHHTNQNDPASVRESICAFLEEQAAVQRLCNPEGPPTPSTIPPAPPTLPDLNTLRLISQCLINQSKGPKRPQPYDASNPAHLPCKHCGGQHWNDDCEDEKAGTSSYLREQRRRTNTELPSMALINNAFADFDPTRGATAPEPDKAFPRSYASVVASK